MSDWLNTPVTVVALLAVLTVFWTMARWTGMVDSGIRELKDGQKELRDDVKTILARLPSKVIESGSPIRLTDLGVEVATALKAETWASDAATRLEEQVAGKRDFEIEQFSREYTRTRLGDEWRDRISACAYSFGLDPSEVESVLGVKLRDALLSRRQASSPSDDG